MFPKIIDIVKNKKLLPKILINLTEVFIIKSMNEHTLKNIIERHHSIRKTQEFENVSPIDELSSKIMLELFKLSKKGILPPETKIFLECKNSFLHLNNILENIFLHGNEIISTLDNELKLINENGNSSQSNNLLLDVEKSFERLETNIEESEERMKQIFFRKTGQIHGHIEHRDPDDKITETGEIIMRRVTHLERKIEESQIPMREMIAQALGVMLPEIIKEETGKLLKDNSDKIIRKLSNLQQTNNQPIKREIPKQQTHRRNTNYNNPHQEEIDDRFF